MDGHPVTGHPTVHLTHGDGGNGLTPRADPGRSRHPRGTHEKPRARWRASNSSLPPLAGSDLQISVKNIFPSNARKLQTKPPVLTVYPTPGVPGPQASRRAGPRRQAREPRPGPCARPEHPAQSTHRPQPSGTAELKGSAPGADTRQRRSQGRAAMPRTGGTGTRDAGCARSQRARAHSRRTISSHDSLCYSLRMLNGH